MLGLKKKNTINAPPGDKLPPSFFFIHTCALSSKQVQGGRFSGCTMVSVSSARMTQWGGKETRGKGSCQPSEQLWQMDTKSGAILRQWWPKVKRSLSALSLPFCLFVWQPAGEKNHLTRDSDELHIEWILGVFPEDTNYSTTSLVSDHRGYY